MKKTILLNLLVAISFSSFSQVFNFENSFPGSSWTYYHNLDSLTSPLITHDSINKRIHYNLTLSTQTSLIYAPLTDTIGGFDGVFKSYSASFKITPASNSTIDPFFPMILSEKFMTGEHKNPWRLNPTNPSFAGDVQDNDMIAVLLDWGNEVTILSKQVGSTMSLIWTPYDSAYFLTSGVDYWIQLKSIDTNLVKMSIFNDSLLTNVLTTQDFVVHSLKPFTYLYVANNNGSSYSYHEGYLDNFRISKENPVSASKVTNLTGLSLYPNPVTNVLNIKQGNQELLTIEVINVLGESLLSVNGTNNQVDVSSLTAGVYFLKVTSKHGQHVEQFVKK
jgi:hypothetical protein